MTRKNLNSNKPFLLQPVGKENLWGGTRLNDDFSKNFNSDNIGESWECSTHSSGASIVASGDFKGLTLIELFKKHPEYLGTKYKKKGELPILIKFIDAKKDLSVQVHPDDEYAAKYENNSLGKTEMWYVLDAKKDASIIYGFKRDIDNNVLRESLENGTVEKYLQKVNVNKDDIFYIESGTVHAIGEGTLIAEIQESSDLTYRLYDYNRIDKNGKLRELHTDKALEVVNLKSSKEPRQPFRVLKYSRGCASEILCRCKYFQVERILINTECYRGLAEFHTNSDSFQVFLCIDGCGIIFDEENDFINFFKGDCIFVPANSVNLKFHGQAQLLQVSC